MKNLFTLLRTHWFALLLLAIGLHLSVFQIFGYDLSRIIGDLGDSRFILAIVEYNYQWMIGTYKHYWDGFFMYPDQEVISYSDNLLGVLPVYSVFRLSGFDYLTSFQLLLISCHALNYLFSYYCFYKLSSNRYASAGAAFLFAFSIVLNGIHNHPQYTFRFCIPLFFYFFYRYLSSLQFKFIIYSGIALVFQFYLGVYLGYFLFISALLFGFCYVLVNRELLKSIKTISWQVVTISPLVILALTPLFYFYYKRNQITGGYYTDYEFYMQTIPRLSSYFKSFGSSVSWGFLNNTPVNSKYEWLHILFPGSIVFITLIFSFYLAIKKNRSVLVLLLVVLFFISFTTYYEGHTLYGYLMKIPGIKAARVVSRVVTVLIFFVAWLFCIQLDFLQTKTRLSSTWIVVLLPLLLVLDNYCLPNGFKSFDKVECKERIQKIEDLLKQNPKFNQLKVFAYTPAIQKESELYHLDAMLCALKLKMKTINGYSSSCHRYYGPFWKNADTLSLRQWCGKMNLSMDSVLVVN